MSFSNTTSTNTPLFPAIQTKETNTSIHPPLPPEALKDNIKLPSVKQVPTNPFNKAPASFFASPAASATNNVNNRERRTDYFSEVNFNEPPLLSFQNMILHPDEVREYPKGPVVKGQRRASLSVSPMAASPTLSTTSENTRSTSTLPPLTPRTSPLPPMTPRR